MKNSMLIVCVAAIVFTLGETAQGQTTEFTYQGRLLSAGLPATGSVDFEFRLFDDVAVGTQVGPTVSLSAVSVNNGVFSVRLDFGNQFPGAARFLEIRVRQVTDDFFTVLSPRQSITSAPYAIKSLTADSATNATAATNALQLNGLDASQYIVASDPRLSDARNPLPHSINYIQNSPAQQPLSNFNISGNGTVGATLSGNLVNAQTEFRIGGNRVLGTPGTSNLFVGTNAGSNTTGGANTFAGDLAGFSNTTGNDGSFFGFNSGFSNTTGVDNSFFGFGSGFSNTTGLNNSFFGESAGAHNKTGNENVFIGTSAGFANVTGSNNTALGNNAGVGSASLTFATAIGAGSTVTASNTIQLGRPNDRVRISGLGTAGSQSLCSNSNNEVSTCSSSIRYKSNISGFSSGLDLIRRLRPVTFQWKESGMRDLGLLAEDVNKVDPLLTTTNEKGEIEGVKYAQLSAVFINAFKDQQAQIEKLQAQIAAQQTQIKTLARRISLRSGRKPASRPK